MQVLAFNELWALLKFIKLAILTNKLPYEQKLFVVIVQYGDYIKAKQIFNEGEIFNYSI